MASNLQKRLDKLEKGIQQLLEGTTGPIYVSDCDPVPEGREAIRIVMRWVEADPQEDELETLEASNSVPRKQPSTLSPPIENAAEREKRWANHLRAIDARGERYQGEREPRDPRREGPAAGHRF